MRSQGLLRYHFNKVEQIACLLFLQRRKTTLGTVDRSAIREPCSLDGVLNQDIKTGTRQLIPLAELLEPPDFLWFGSLFNNLDVFQPLQIKIRPGGKRVMFRLKLDAVTAFIKKVGANGGAGFFQSLGVNFTSYKKSRRLCRLLSGWG